MPEALYSLPAHELLARYRSGDARVTDAVRSVLDHIDATEPGIQAYLDVWRDRALEQAAALDKRYAAGDDPGPLAGVPVALKDNMVTSTGRTTCASKILGNFEGPYDATVVERLRGAGAVFLGKLNMDEFAMGSSTENSSVQETKNPWDHGRVPGGSSGGAAASVAAGSATIAIGSDTGGSIRQPAAFCGCVGFKPTYGRVSRYGLIAFASSLDQIGPFTRDIEDLALAMNVIAGRDERDATSADIPVPDYTQYLNRDIEGLRVGLPKEYFGEGLGAEMRGLVDRAVDALRSQGAEVVDVSLPHTDYGIAVYYIIAPAEASANLARFDAVRYGYRNSSAKNFQELYRLSRSEGFGPEVQRRIMLGTYVLSSGYYDAYYLKAQKVRTLIRNDFRDAFTQCDVIATPTTPSAAFPLGDKAGDPLQMYLNDIYTNSANLAGVPAISMPCGLTNENLPAGLQLIGRPFEEHELIRVAHAYERTGEGAIGLARAQG